MASTARPKPVGLRLKPRLPLGLQRTDDTCLMAPIEDHGNSERMAFGAAAPLRDVHASDGKGLERLGAVLNPFDQSGFGPRGSTTSPSTPAVRRPALRSVTRRTLTSVFARDLIINFCRLRTLTRSPAFDAVKIRCRSRRTSSSTRRQSTWRQSKGASSGPFTTTVAMASNLSSGSGVLVIFFSTSSPDRVSTLSRRTTRVRIRPVSRNDRLEETASMSRFPAALLIRAWGVNCHPWVVARGGCPGGP